MSVRIYQLAKQLKLENRKVIELLRARGLNVNSPSNTIPTIYANALIEELKEASIDQQDGGDQDVQEVRNDNDKDENDIDVAQSSKVDDLETDEVNYVVPETVVTSKSDVVEGNDVQESQDNSNDSHLVTAANTIVIKRSIPIQPKRMHNPLEDIIKASKLAREKKLKEAAKPKVKREDVAQSDKFFVKSQDSVIAKHSNNVVATAHSTENKNQAINNDSEQKAIDSKLKEEEDRRPVFRPFLKKIERPVKNTVLKTIVVKQPIIVRDLAEQMNVKPFQLISKLMSMSVFASMNHALEPENAQRVAEKFGYILEIKHRGDVETKSKPKVEKKVAVPDKTRNLTSRPPVVCVLGHVDHGKTTLLDTIRKAHVAKGEAGGITQHVAAYQVEHEGKKITFIDTPGHAAFSKMRERGANITDIAVLVVAADDGFMPQTDEALNFAKRANIPVIVAINKIDAKGANVDHVKLQMQQRGIMSEDWGGETLCSSISALNGTNISELLELILLQAEMMELKADSADTPSGVILESQVEIGRGPTASVIIKEGSVHIGDCIVCGTAYCKVRALLNDHDKSIKVAPPSTPVKIIGWTDVPDVGADFSTVKNEKIAREIVEENIAAAKIKREEALKKNEIVDVEQLFSAMSEENDKVLRVIICADVQGSIEALEGCLLAIDSKKVKLEIIGYNVGAISKNDIELANTAEATIVAFNTKFDVGAQSLAKNYGTKVIQHNIIYEIIEQVQEAMADLLDPELHEQKVGAAEVRQIFQLKVETVAGCMVTEGKILRDKFVRVVRKKNIIFQGKFASIKHLKEDLTEVRAGFECGICIAGFEDFEIGDILECFEIQKIQPSL